MIDAEHPPGEYARFLSLPFTVWKRLPHRHIHVFMNEVGHVKCAICWEDIR